MSESIRNFTPTAAAYGTAARLVHAGAGDEMPRREPVRAEVVPEGQRARDDVRQRQRQRQRDDAERPPEALHSSGPSPWDDARTGSGSNVGRDTKSTRRCVPSQYGFVPEWPHRHSFTWCPSATVITFPSASSIVIGPVTMYGPFGWMRIVMPGSRPDICRDSPPRSEPRGGRTRAAGRARRAGAG